MKKSEWSLLFFINVVDIRFGRTSFDKVVSAVEKFFGIKSNPSCFTRTFDGNLQTLMHTINLPK